MINRIKKLVLCSVLLVALFVQPVQTAVMSIAQTDNNAIVTDTTTYDGVVLDYASRYTTGGDNFVNYQIKGTGSIANVATDYAATIESDSVVLGFKMKAEEQIALRIYINDDTYANKATTTTTSDTTAGNYATSENPLKLPALVNGEITQLDWHHSAIWLPAGFDGMLVLDTALMTRIYGANRVANERSTSVILGVDTSTNAGKSLELLNISLLSVNGTLSAKNITATTYYDFTAISDQAALEQQFTNGNIVGWARPSSGTIAGIDNQIVKTYAPLLKSKSEIGGVWLNDDLTSGFKLSMKEDYDAVNVDNAYYFNYVQVYQAESEETATAVSDGIAVKIANTADIANGAIRIEIEDTDGEVYRFTPTGLKVTAPRKAMAMYSATKKGTIDEYANAVWIPERILTVYMPYANMRLMPAGQANVLDENGASNVVANSKLDKINRIYIGYDNRTGASHPEIVLGAMADIDYETKFINYLFSAKDYTTTTDASDTSADINFGEPIKSKTVKPATSYLNGTGVNINTYWQYSTVTADELFLLNFAYNPTKLTTIGDVKVLMDFNLSSFEYYAGDEMPTLTAEQNDTLMNTLVQLAAQRATVKNYTGLSSDYSYGSAIEWTIGKFPNDYSGDITTSSGNPNYYSNLMIPVSTENGDFTGAKGLTVYVKNLQNHPIDFWFEANQRTDTTTTGNKRWRYDFQGLPYFLYDEKTGEEFAMQTARAVNQPQGARIAMYIPANFEGWIRMPFEYFSNPDYNIAQGANNVLNFNELFNYIIISASMTANGGCSYVIDNVGIYFEEFETVSTFNATTRSISQCMAINNYFEV